MVHRKSLSAVCPVHGDKLHRDTCRACNNAYMRSYLAQRRTYAPAREMWERASKRARRLGIPFALPKDAVVIPDICPALGGPIRTGGTTRSPQSPSLDRIRPDEGYVLGNIRVLSDHANRLKGNLSLEDIERRAQAAGGQRQVEYERLAEYVRREQLLAEVRAKAASLEGRAREVWSEIARFLEKAFIRADWKR